MVRRPRFEQREFDRVRELRLDAPPAASRSRARGCRSRLRTSSSTRTPLRSPADRNRSIAADDDARRGRRIPSPLLLRRREPRSLRSATRLHDDLVEAVARTFGDWARRRRRHDVGRRSVDADPPSVRPRTPGARRSPGIGAVGAADRARGRSSQHARLPRPPRAEHGPGRPVRQPDQPEPARRQGLHVRRAHRLRVPARPRPVHSPGERADRRDGRRHPRGARRS